MSPELTWIEWFLVPVVVFPFVAAIGIFTLVSLLAIRLIAFALVVVPALVIAYHAARYAGVEFGHEPAAVAKGVGR